MKTNTCEFFIKIVCTECLKALKVCVCGGYWWGVFVYMFVYAHIWFDSVEWMV